MFNDDAPEGYELFTDAEWARFDELAAEMGRDVGTDHGQSGTIASDPLTGEWAGDTTPTDVYRFVAEHTDADADRIAEADECGYLLDLFEAAYREAAEAAAAWDVQYA